MFQLEQIDRWGWVPVDGNILRLSNNSYLRTLGEGIFFFFWASPRMKDVFSERALFIHSNNYFAWEKCLVG